MKSAAAIQKPSSAEKAYRMRGCRSEARQIKRLRLQENPVLEMSAPGRILPQADQLQWAHKRHCPRSKADAVGHSNGGQAELDPGLF